MASRRGRRSAQGTYSRSPAGKGGSQATGVGVAQHGAGARQARLHCLLAGTAAAPALWHAELACSACPAAAQAAGTTRAWAC